MPEAPTIKLTPQHVFGVYVVVQRRLLEAGAISKSMFEDRLKREAAKLGLDWRIHRFINRDGEVQ